MRSTAKKRASELFQALTATSVAKGIYGRLPPALREKYAEMVVKESSAHKTIFFKVEVKSEEVEKLVEALERSEENFKKSIY